MIATSAQVLSHRALRMNAYTIAVSCSRSNRPAAPPCPGSMFVSNSNRFSSVLCARNFATPLAGSQQVTRGSVNPAVTVMCG